MSDRLEEIIAKRKNMDMFDRDPDANKIDSEELDWLIAEVEKLTKERDEHNDCVDSYKRDAAGWHRRAETAEVALTNSKNEIKKLEAENVFIEAQLQVTTEAMDLFEKDHKEEITTLKASLKASEKKVAQLEIEINLSKMKFKGTP